MESYFLSDIHLKSMSERNGKILLRFLRSLLDKSNLNQVQIFFLGDIFDLWVSDGKVFIEKYKDLIDEIRELSKRGVKFYFFEGNHDLHIDPFWKKKLNVDVFVDPEYIQIDDLLVRLEHGDLINLDDKNYLKLRRFLRHPGVEMLGHLIPGFVWQALGNQWSPKSRKKSSQYRVQNQDKLIKMIRHHAERSFQERPFDLIITGHMHVRDDYQIPMPSRTIRSINLGSWFDDDVFVLKIDKGLVEWLKLENT